MSVTQPELVPFKLLLAVERGKDRRWDRELSGLIIGPGTLSPALISAVSFGLICKITGGLCNVQHTTYCIDLLFSVKRFYFILLDI